MVTNLKKPGRDVAWRNVTWRGGQTFACHDSHVIYSRVGAEAQATAPEHQAAWGRRVARRHVEFALEGAVVLDGGRFLYHSINSISINRN